METAPRRASQALDPAGREAGSKGGREAGGHLGEPQPTLVLAWEDTSGRRAGDQWVPGLRAWLWGSTSCLLRAGVGSLV